MYVVFSIIKQAGIDLTSQNWLVGKVLALKLQH
jgi:hypothetical protein